MIDYSSNGSKKLVNKQDYLLLAVEKQDQEMLGFIIGQLVTMPEVYNSGDLTLTIDDFCARVKNL